MSLFLLCAAAGVLASVALALVRVLLRPGAADRLMAVQLFGTGGIAAMLLLAQATGMPGALDAALVLAMVAGFVSIAFVRGGREGEKR